MRFTQKRKDFKYMHYAIDHVNLNLMFPDYSPDRSSKPEELAMLLDKTNLNKAQRGVIEDILDPFTSHVSTHFTLSFELPAKVKVGSANLSSIIFQIELKHPQSN